MQILDYQPHRSHEVVALWRASFEHGVGIVDHHPIEEQHAHFVDNVVPNHRVRVAVQGDEIVAFMGSTPQSIGHLYVKVGWHGRGIGSALMALAKAESAGSLWLYTFARNTNACRFYARHGFVEVERESENMWKLEAIRFSWPAPADPSGA